MCPIRWRILSILTLVSSRASSLHSEDLNTSDQLVYSFNHLSRGDRRTIRRARFSSDPKIVKLSQVEGGDEPQVTYIFDVRARQQVLLSPGQKLQCNCTGSSSRTTLCEHMWAVQETLVEHSAPMTGSRGAPWRFDNSPVATVASLELGMSQPLYDIFNNTKPSICAKLHLNEDDEDERACQAASALVLCAVSPSYLLPSELFANIGSQDTER